MRVLARVEAGGIAGYGHLERTMSLAQALERRGTHKVVFMISSVTPEVRARVERRGFALGSTCWAPGSSDDLAETQRCARELDAKLVVIDGYAFGEGFIEDLRHEGRLVCRIDDSTAHATHADVLIFGHLHGAPPATEPRGLVLAGPRYALVRRVTAKAETRTRTGVNRLLVSLGGGSHPEAIARVVAAIAGRREVRLLAGTTPRESLSGVPSSWQVLPMVDDVAEHLAWADAAILAAGTTVLLASMVGVPMIVTPIADNQRPVAFTAVAEGLALFGGSDADVTSIARALERIEREPKLRSAMISRQRATVDGLGAERCADAITRLLAQRSAA